MRFSPMYYNGKDDWLTAEPDARMWKKSEELGAVLNFFVATDSCRSSRRWSAHPEVPVIIDHVSQIDLSAADPRPEMKKLLACAVPRMCG